MELSNFKIANDNIALEQGEEYFDLHNCFDFVGLKYDVSKRLVSLYWVKGNGDWMPKNSPLEIEMSISGVYVFKAQERDKDIPFTEDDCLSSIGFLWNELIEEMGGYHSNEPKEGCTHLSLEFMSGFALKIGAESASIDARFSA